MGFMHRSERFHPWFIGDGLLSNRLGYSRPLPQRLGTNVPLSFRPLAGIPFHPFCIRVLVGYLTRRFSVNPAAVDPAPQQDAAY